MWVCLDLLSEEDFGENRDKFGKGQIVEDHGM